MKRISNYGAVILISLMGMVAHGENCVSNLTQLHAAIAVSKPGDIIQMSNGVWSNAVIHFDADGLPGQSITLQAETHGQVWLEGASKLQIAGDYLVVQGLHFRNGSIERGNVIEFRGSSSDPAHHSRFTECAITGYNPSDPEVNYKWVSVYGTSNRVDHCHFSGMNHVGVTLTVWPKKDGAANRTRIDANYFGNRAPGAGNGYETIRIGTSTVSHQESNAVVESNYFYRCDGEIEIISNKTVGNTYRRNVFAECKGQLTLRHGSHCRVEENFFFGNNVPSSGGVRIVGANHRVINNYFFNLEGTGLRAGVALMNGVPDSPANRYAQVTNARVLSNTFVNCRSAIVIGTESSVGDTTLPPADCVIANNVVFGNEGSLIDEINVPSNMLYEGNVSYDELNALEPSFEPITPNDVGASWMR